MTRHLIIILGDQLTPENPALEGFDATCDQIVMAEVMGEGTHVWSHKARIALFLSAMRHFAQTLETQGMPVTYYKLGAHPYTHLQEVWLQHIQQYAPQKIIVCEPGEYRVLQMLNEVAQQTHTSLIVRDDTHFMCSQANFKRWAGQSKSLRMEFFYRNMRKEHQVLMQGAQPEGGDWNYDHENRKSFGKRGPQGIPSSPKFAIDSITHEVFAEVEHHFAEHPGSLAHFCWPVTRAQALDFLNTFIDHKLADFGMHQDAMWQGGEHPQHAFLWHSLLASSLNLKLLNPREVIQAAEQAYRKNKLSLASVEGFIRQILGWREFIRGVYWLDMPAMATSNYYEHHRQLPSWYWTGNTHMNCMRQTISQTLQYGYAHHIQRLMVTGMFGLLAEIAPNQVEDWYLAVYVDAVEWVELPNVAGMALYANGGRFTSKPYVASGAYIQRMSNYCQGCRYKPDIKTGAQACPVTSLYWHFLIKHYDEFARNPRTALMVKHVDKMTDEQRNSITDYAQGLLAQLDGL
jgi:deoxyribodipyrimidine photolyase-related protein